MKNEARIEVKGCGWFFRATSMVYSDLEAVGYTVEEAVKDCMRKVRLREYAEELDKIREMNRKGVSHA